MEYWLFFFKYDELEDEEEEDEVELGEMIPVVPMLASLYERLVDELVWKPLDP